MCRRGEESRVVGRPGSAAVWAASVGMAETHGPIPADTPATPPARNADRSDELSSPPAPCQPQPPLHRLAPRVRRPQRILALGGAAARVRAHGADGGFGCGGARFASDVRAKARPGDARGSGFHATLGQVDVLQTADRDRPRRRAGRLRGIATPTFSPASSTPPRTSPSMCATRGVHSRASHPTYSRTTTRCVQFGLRPRTRTAAFSGRRRLPLSSLRELSITGTKT